MGHAVGSGIEEDDEVSRFDCGERSVAGEEVSGLADGAYNIDDQRRLPCWLLYWDDLVVSVVERGTDEVVHGGVGDDEGFGAVFFDVENAGQESTGLGYDEAARFEEEMGGFAGETLRESSCVFFYLLRGVKGSGSVVDAEAAAGVDVADVVAVFAQVGDEAGDAGEGGGEGVDFANLRADVDGDSGGVEPL